MSKTWDVDTLGGTLLEVARKANHSKGLPWTNPATGETHLPPKRGRKSVKRNKSAKKARKGRR